MKVTVRSWGPLRQRLGWGEQHLQLDDGATVREALWMAAGIPVGSPWTGNDGSTLYEIVTKDGSIRVDKWLCFNGRIRTDRQGVLSQAMSEGDQILVMEAAVLGGG